MKAAIAEGAGLYADAARSLAETGRCRVILCARPEEIREHDSEPPGPPGGDDADGEEDHGETEIGRDFHDLLKAQALGLACPLQVMRRETWEGTVKGSDVPRPLQDEATRAWNLHIALYYKAGGTPWRMPRRDSDLSTCYVGVSFYRTTDGEELHTAVAQVFNERGDGVVVRGGTAKISKADRRPHLGESRRPQAAQRRARRVPAHPRPPARPHRAAQDLAVQSRRGQRVPGRGRRAGDRLPRADLDPAARRPAPVPHRAAPAAARHQRPARPAHPPAVHAGIRSRTSGPTPACTSRSRSCCALPGTAPTSRLRAPTSWPCPR